MKKNGNPCMGIEMLYPWLKFSIKMKLTIFFLFLVVSQSFAVRLYSQRVKLDLEIEQASIKKVLKEIESKSDFYFLYNDDLIDVTEVVDVNVRKENIKSILNSIFEGREISYYIKGKQIVLSPSFIKSGEAINQQIKTVSGTVVDEHNEPLPGVTVVIKGTTMGTITDTEGNYTIENLPENTVLVFSFVGMRTQEIPVENESTIRVRLSSDSIGLEEVVAVGYGVQKKKLVTGATTQVKGADLEKMNTASPLGALQSQSPGVNIVKESGQPGSGYKVTIRGVGTIGNASPLYVVDGVTVDNIDDLASSDIASIDVLKDAASAAIYGARAANGVVLVSTKQGKAGKPQISYDGYFGIQTLGKTMHPLMGQEYMDIMDEASVNDGGSPYNWSSIIPNYAEIQSGKFIGTDWLDALVNDEAYTQNHSVNITGGTKQSVYSIGLSYVKQDGLMGEPSPSSYDRYSLRINSEHTLINNSEWNILKIGENVNLSRSSRNVINTEGQWNTIRNSMAMFPMMPIYDEAGDYTVADGYSSWISRANPQAMLYYNNKDNKRISNKLVGNLYAELRPMKDLVVRSSFGINGLASTYRKYVPLYYVSSEKFTVNDEVTQSMSTGYKYIFENSANYKFSLGKNSFDALIGSSYEKSGIGMSLNTKNEGSIFDDFEHAYIDNAEVVDPTLTTIGGSPLDQDLLMSYFGRVNYNYNETYMATIVMRADGSSKFAEGKRWGYFPSVSLGWNITNESFMQQTSNWLDFLKLRGSWGQNGNQNIDGFQYLSTIAFDSKYAMGTDYATFQQGAYPSILANPDVTWETSDQVDVGFDARFLDGRLSSTFDWYNKKTKDWLVQAPISGSIGTGAPYINGGDIRNRGFEIGFSWRDKVDEFSYGASLNLSHNKNEVLRIANTEGIIHGETSLVRNTAPEMYRAEVGKPVGYFWGYKTAGIFQSQDQIDAYVNSNGEQIMPDAKPGDLIFVNLDDNNLIDPSDKTLIGDPNPDFNFSMAFNCEYKGFDFLINASGVSGNQIFRMYRGWGADPTFNYVKEDIDGHWTETNHSNTIPRVTLNGINDLYISDRFVENGDYLRINNITLGYDFKNLLPGLMVRKARFYASVQNAFTITGYKGFDPEVGSGDNWAGGIDLGIYPLPRTFMIGISINY